MAETKGKKYYKARDSYYISVYPFIVPKDSLLTEKEIIRYRIGRAIPIFNSFDVVYLSPSKTEKLYYAFRFEK